MSVLILLVVGIVFEELCLLIIIEVVVFLYLRVVLIFLLLNKLYKKVDV